ncbi:MAG: alpha/beta hydrolase family esterase [Microbacteriaceae bacterium]
MVWPTALRAPLAPRSHTATRARTASVLVSAAAAVLLLGGCAVPAGSGVVESAQPRQFAHSSELLQSHALVHDGVEREYDVFVPAAAAADMLRPVLIALHGAGGDAERMATYTGLSAIADRDGFIVVYPQGTIAAELDGEYSWNAGVCCGIPARTGIDDVGFIDAVIRDVQENFPADPSRIFVTGFSNGGMLAHRLACESSEPIAGIAVVSGALSGTACESRRPMPVLLIHGTADETVPYLGGATNARTGARFGSWVNPSVAEGTEAWFDTNGCGATWNSVITGAVSSVGFDGCRAGTDLVVVTLDGWTHSWPRAEIEAGGFDASRFIVEFFGLTGEADGPSLAR